MPDIDWIPPEAARPTEPTICLNMTKADDANVAFFAFRYALERDTTAPYIVVPWILEHWDAFPTAERDQMQREIQNMFERRERGGAAIPDSADLWQRVLERAT